MDDIFGFILDCLTFSRSTRTERRNMFGCLFAMLGVFTVVLFGGLLIVWSLLTP